MAVDYDLAIVGNGEQATLLALRASQLKARVALVTEPNTIDLEKIQTCLGRLLADRTIPAQLPTAISQIERELDPYDRLEQLQATGVDTILGTGQFSNRTTFTTTAPSQREIRARAFAIVVDRAPPLRQIMGFNEIEPFSLDRLLEPDALPKQLAIIGGSAIDCLTAQVLCRLGHEVTIFTDRPHILADLDIEIARILQAQLEVEGTRIYTTKRITAITKPDRTSYQVWAGEHTSRYERILLPSWRDSSADRLNLSRAGIYLSAGEIRINAKLQTTNRRIYICQRRTDIHTILANTLFLPIAKVDRQIVLQAIDMQPNGASVGITEIDARLRYGQDLYVLHNTDAEFCKLLCRRNGTIVGAHAVGSQAIELIETVAIAMHAKLSVYQLARMADAVGSPIAQLATKLDEQIYIRNLGRQIWLEKWFNWRRQWNI